MKHQIATILALALFGFGLPASAQEVIVSGTVVGVAPDTGTMILSTAPNATVTLTGLHQARIRAADRRAVALNSIRPGMRVSVGYLPHGQRWVLSRVLIPSIAEPAVVPLLTDRRYDSLFDGDITTNPGSKAAVDGDITTKPDGVANRDGDRTTKADR